MADMKRQRIERERAERTKLRIRAATEIQVCSLDMHSVGDERVSLSLVLFSVYCPNSIHVLLCFPERPWSAPFPRARGRCVSAPFPRASDPALVCPSLLQSCWRGHRARVGFGLSARILATCLRRRQVLIDQRQAGRMDRAARAIQSLWLTAKAVRARRAAVDAICRLQALVSGMVASIPEGRWAACYYGVTG